MDAGCWDVNAEIPPRETVRGGGLDRRRSVMDAGKNCRVLDAAVEEASMRVVAGAWNGSHLCANGHLAGRAGRTCDLRLPAIHHTPAALQRNLPEPKPSIGGCHPQLVPA